MEKIRHELSPYAFLTLVVLGVALFNSAKWVMLDASVQITQGVTYTSRFVGVATYIAMAVFCYRQMPSVKQLLYIIVSFVGIYLTVSMLAPFVGDLTLQTVIYYTSGVLYGIAGSLFMLMYAHVFSVFRPIVSAVCFGAVQLMTNIFMLFLSVVDTSLVIPCRYGFVIVAIILLVYCTMMLLNGTIKPDHQYQFQHQNSEQSSGQVETEKAFASDSGSFPYRMADWIFLILAGGVFSTFFGLFSQLCSESGASFGLYDINTDVILIVIEIIVLVFLCLRGDRFEIVLCLFVVTILCATGFALFPHSSASDSPLAGALVRGGFDCINIFMFALLARKSYQNPSRTFFYFALYRSVASVYPGRLMGTAFLGSGISQAELIGSVSQICLWVICLFWVLSFLLAYRRKIGFSSHIAESKQEEPNSTEVDEFTLRIDSFCSHYQLSEREREVLVEILRGYTREAIAKKMYLSPETIKNYTGRIYSKVGVNSKQGLISLFYEEKLNI